MFIAQAGWGFVEGAIQGLLRSLTEGVAGVVNEFNRRLITLPAAGSATDPATWMPPEDPYWQAAFIVYGMLSAFVLPLVWGVGWFNVGVPRGARRRERLKQFATAFVLIVAGWSLLQLWFHFWNTAALAFAPSGGEFLATPGNTAKLGVGLIVGALLLIYNALVILAGIVMHLLFVVLTFIFVAFWPLSVALYATDLFVFETMGTSGIIGTLLLGPLQFVKAVILRLMFEFDLDMMNPETVITFLIIALGVTLAFLGVPYFGLKRLLPRSIVASGRRMKRRHGDRVRDWRESAPSAGALKGRIESVHARGRSRLSQRGGSGSSMQSRSRERGSSGVRSLSPERRRQMGTAQSTRDTRSRTHGTTDD